MQIESDLDDSTPTHSCEKCHQQWCLDSDWEKRVYFVDAENHCPLLTTDAYCLDCNTLVAAEQLLTLEQIDGVIDDVQQFGCAPFRFENVPQHRMRWSYYRDMLSLAIKRSFVRSGRLQAEQFLRVLQTMRQWRQLRQSGPRCLVCEGQNILSSDWGVILHPQCGGKITRLPIPLELVSYVSWPPACLHSIEGHLIQQKGESSTR